MPHIARLADEVAALDRVGNQMREAAERLFEREIEAGAKSYRRARDLRGLIGPRADTLSDSEIVETLERTVRAASNALQSGHWTADRNRVIALRQALAAERAALGITDLVGGMLAAQGARS